MNQPFDSTQLLGNCPVVWFQSPSQFEVGPRLGEPFEFYQGLRSPEEALHVGRIDRQRRGAVIDHSLELHRLQTARGQIQLALAPDGNGAFDDRITAARFVVDLLQILQGALETADGERNVIGGVEFHAASLVLFGPLETFVDLQIVDVGGTVQRLEGNVELGTLTHRPVVHFIDLDAGQVYAALHVASFALFHARYDSVEQFRQVGVPLADCYLGVDFETVKSKILVGNL